MRSVDHELLLRLAALEDRTVQGVMARCVRAYAEAHAPALWAEVSEDAASASNSATQRKATALATARQGVAA